MRSVPEATRAAWADGEGPASLFMQLWAEASQWTPADRAMAPDIDIDTRRRLGEATQQQDRATALEQLCQIIEAEWPGGSNQAERCRAGGLILAAMRAIDSVFALAHPRTRTVSPATGSTGSLPRWVDAINRLRLRKGCFAESDSHRLIPHGPFARHARGRDAESGDSLRDSFAYLAVAPKVSMHDNRPIAIAIKVIGTDVMRGVPAAASIGRERIRFIPLAERATDLAFISGHRHGHPVLDVQPAVDTSGRFLQALSSGSDVDIAFAPELTVAGCDEDNLRGGIQALREHAPRIIMAGSGLTVGKGECGRSWNEARVFARGGQLLWRHRKVWPFGMQRETAMSYGFPDPGDGNMLMEDIAGNAEFTIVDMDGFGRCIVLICQDFECRPLVDEIISHYQPDWVFTPILDPGVKIGGWAHQRAQSLSKLSQARLLVGSSLSMSTLGSHSAWPEPAVGLAVGPFTPHPDDASANRAVALVQAVAGPSPRSGLLLWDHSSGAWQQTTVGAS